MRELLWRVAFVALWVLLVVAGLWFLRPVFGYLCDDCINRTSGGVVFSGGGFKDEWPTVIVVSVLNATFVTGLLAVGSRAFRWRSDSVVRG